MATDVLTGERHQASLPWMGSPPDTLPPLENGDRLSRSAFEQRYEAMPHVKKAELHFQAAIHMAQSSTRRMAAEAELPSQSQALRLMRIAPMTLAWTSSRTFLASRMVSRHETPEVSTRQVTSTLLPSTAASMHPNTGGAVQRMRS